MAGRRSDATILPHSGVCRSFFRRSESAFTCRLSQLHRSIPPVFPSLLLSKSISDAAVQDSISAADVSQYLAAAAALRELHTSTIIL